MTSFKIDQIFKEIQRDKQLDHSAYVFYNIDLLESRRKFKSAISRIGEEKHQKLLEYAAEYVQSNDDYLGLTAMHEYYDVLPNVKGVTVEQDHIKFLTNNLKDLFNVMEKSGVIDILRANHNIECEKNGLSTLKVTKEQICDEFDVSTNSRNKLAMLYLKNAFWLGKYIKVLKGIHFQDVINENFEGINKKGFFADDLNYLLYMSFKKYKILKIIYVIDSSSKEDANVSADMCNEYKDKYKNTFKEIFPNVNNDIFEDYDKFYQYRILKENLADRRNTFIQILLKNQIIETKNNTLNPSIKHWGIKKDMYSNLLGLEPEGYMLPVVFKIPTYVYSDVLKSLDMERVSFPEFEQLYRDEEKDKYFPTNVLVNPTLEQKKQIKLQSKEKGKNQEFLKRISDQIVGKPHSYEKPNMVEIEI